MALCDGGRKRTSTVLWRPHLRISWPSYIYIFFQQSLSPRIAHSERVQYSTTTSEPGNSPQVVADQRNRRDEFILAYLSNEREQRHCRNFVFFAKYSPQGLDATISLIQCLRMIHGQDCGNKSLAIYIGGGLTSWTQYYIYDWIYAKWHRRKANNLVFGNFLSNIFKLRGQSPMANAIGHPIDLDPDKVV